MSVLEVEEMETGIWIDQESLREAGLTLPIRVIVDAGEIRIVPASAVEATPAPNADAWDAFRSLGSDAHPGQLRDAASEHDRYLYGKQR